MASGLPNQRGGYTFGDMRALMQRPASEALWRRLLAVVRAWPDAEQRRCEIVPYVAAHLRHWPLRTRRLDMEYVLLCDEAQSEVMRQRWNAATSELLPLVAQDAEWLRPLLGHLEDDARHASKLKLLMHAGAFSRVRSASFSYYEGAKPFLEELKRAFTAHHPESALSALEFESCFFHSEAVETLMRLVDVSSVRSLRLSHAIKPSAINALCDEAWAGVEHFTLTGDLLRVEDARVVWQSALCANLKSARLGYFVDARGAQVEPLLGELLGRLEQSSARLERLALPGLHLTAEAARVMADSPALASVQALDLRDNALDEATLRALFHPNSHLLQVKHLRLGHWHVQDDAIHVLQRS